MTISDRDDEILNRCPWLTGEDVFYRRRLDSLCAAVNRHDRMIAGCAALSRFLSFVYMEALASVLYNEPLMPLFRSLAFKRAIAEGIYPR